ncbi:MAG: DUF1489 domain-containing protein [Nitratireductor sp.]
MEESVDNSLNLIKLCVGAEKVQDLIDWQKTARARGPDGMPRHVTRMWPKREAELLDGGSLYWVFKGVVLARQRLIRFDEVVREDGIRRCGLVLDPNVHRTEAAPKRAFQGWRYLEGNVAPRDLSKGSANVDLPPKLMAALAEIGVR